MRTSIDALGAAWIGNFIAYTGLLRQVSSLVYGVERGSNLILESNKAFNRTIYHLHQELEFTIPFEDTFEVSRRFIRLYEEMYHQGLPYTLFEVRFTPKRERILIGAQSSLHVISGRRRSLRVLRQVRRRIWRRNEWEEIHNPLPSTRLDKRRRTMHQPNDVELATMFEVAESLEDGVWWIELAQLSEPELAPQRKRLRDLCHRAVARRAATGPRFHRSEGLEGHLRAARPPGPCTVDMSGDRLATMGSAKREKEE